MGTRGLRLNFCPELQGSSVMLSWWLKLIYSKLPKRLQIKLNAAITYLSKVSSSFLDHKDDCIISSISELSVYYSKVLETLWRHTSQGASEAGQLHEGGWTGAKGDCSTGCTLFSWHHPMEPEHGRTSQTQWGEGPGLSRESSQKE